MDTVQLQCGSCGQVMAIQVEHLGTQVHCPHCRAVVQAPAAQSSPPSLDATVLMPPSEGQERESIFGGPEPTDDLFDVGPASPKPLIPSPPSPLPNISLEPATEPLVSPTMHAVALTQRPRAEPQQAFTPMTPAAAPDAAESLPALAPRRIERAAYFVPILLIFLIPYSIITTAYVVYLLVQQNRQVHPLKMLPDPAKDKGAPRQIKHDLPLSQDMKVPLQKSLRIGALEVTPLKVRHVRRTNDLVLELKAKNVSQNLAFNPIADEFLKTVERSMDSGKPYTYLEAGGKRFYGGFLEWRKGNQKFDGEISPGEEEVIRVITADKYRAEIKKILQSSATFVWRVQVRQGLVQVEGRPISATAVIGVEFAAKAIEKEG